MNRNLNANFSKAAHINVQRSIIPIKSGTSTTCNAGDLVPFYYRECLPGGTYSLDTSFVARLAPSIHATMDNAFIDFFYFFVPNRILWDDWKHFCGEPESYWTPTQTYTVPQIKFPAYGYSVGSVADHFGLPVNVGKANTNFSVSVLPFLAYCQIWNQWFRDENLQSPVYCPTTTTALQNLTGWQVGSAPEIASPLEGAMHGATLLKACKPHDFFTSCLPSPQRGPDVPIPLTQNRYGLPVGTLGIQHTAFNQGSSSQDNYFPLQWRETQGNSVTSGEYVSMYGYATGIASSSGITTVGNETGELVDTFAFTPSNLYATTAAGVIGTLNDLRYAFALQHLYEDLARNGARYRSILHGIFGVDDPDPTHDIPIYLGGGRTQVGMSTVIQTSGDTSGTALGETAGYSHTSNSEHSFSYSSTEHGMIIGVFTIRQAKTYCQGIPSKWQRKDRFDFYWPEFASVGELPVKRLTLYFDPTNDNKNDSVFGYQEAWADYRYDPYTVTGLFRPGVSGSLSSWNYADYYTSAPTLSDTWIEDNSRANIDRTLAVPSSTSGCQFLVDIALDETDVLPMPVYSIPGLDRL